MLIHRKKVNFLFSLGCLLPTPMFFVQIGFVQSLFMCFVVSILLMYNYLNYSNSIKLTAFDIIFFILYLSLCLSSFMSNTQPSAIMLVQAMFIYFATRTLDPSMARQILLAFVAVILISSIYSLFVSDPSVFIRRFKLFGLPSNSTALTYALSLLIILCTLRYKNIKVVKSFILFIFIILMLYLTYLTGSRKVLMINLLTSAVIIVRARLVGVFLLTILCAYIYSPSIISINNFPLLNRFSNLINPAAGGSVSIRAEMISAGLDGFYASPFVGWGFDSFRVMEAFQNRYSHSNVVEILYSLGLLGAILYFFFYVGIISYFLKVLNSKIIVINMSIALIIFNFVDVIYYNPYYIFVLSLLTVSLSVQVNKSRE